MSIIIKNATKDYKLYKSKSETLKQLLFGRSNAVDFKALDKFSYTFEAGKIYGILGHNGSGKSTLLKVISGITSLTSGEVIKEGTISFLNIAVGLDSEFTGRENIYYKGMLMGLSKQHIDDKIESIIEFSELGVFIDQPVKKYSSGMKSKLGFSISVIMDADILIIDEALAVGDANFKQKCKAKVNEYYNENKTIIYVSHNAASIREFCQEVIWIEKGKLITFGSPVDVTKQYDDFNKSKKSVQQLFKDYKIT